VAKRYPASAAPSAKVSRSPIRRNGRPRPASAIVSATAEPSPPITEWFSAVTTIPAPAAAERTVSSSSGLITATLTTDTDTPCSPSARAAPSAAATIIPLANSATSQPAVSTSARSRRSAWSSSKITGISPRLSRTYTGPGRSATASTTWRVVVASATSTTVMFGSTRISATSSIAWWLGPPGVDTPGMKPMIRTGSPG